MNDFQQANRPVRDHRGVSGRPRRVVVARANIFNPSSYFDFLARLWALGPHPPNFILHHGHTLVHSSSQFEEQVLLKSVLPCIFLFLGHHTEGSHIIACHLFIPYTYVPSVNVLHLKPFSFFMLACHEYSQGHLELQDLNNYESRGCASSLRPALN